MECDMCEDCGGEGVVPRLASVYGSGPHVAYVGTQPCEQCSEDFNQDD